MVHCAAYYTVEREKNAAVRRGRRPPPRTGGGCGWLSSWSRGDRPEETLSRKRNGGREAEEAWSSCSALERGPFSMLSYVRIRAFTAVFYASSSVGMATHCASTRHVLGFKDTRARPPGKNRRWDLKRRALPWYK